MTKHLMVLLIAAFAGLFQATAEHIARSAMKEPATGKMAPRASGGPRVSTSWTCRNSTAQRCAEGHRRGPETKRNQTKRKTVSRHHRR
jgi:hypothetical protein